jgi:hypothetical protein
MKKLYHLIAIAVIACALNAKVEANNNIKYEIKTIKLNEKVIFTEQFAQHKVSVFEVGQSNDQKEQALKAQQQKKEEEEKRLSPAYNHDSNAVKIMTDEAYRDSKGRSNCVAFATKYTGIHKALGWGVTIRAEGKEPKVGAIALDARRGHAAVVMAISGDLITLWDSNWVVGYVTQRVVNKNTQRGYIY